MKWETVRLGELIDIKHGYAFKGEFFSDSGEHILLTPGNCHGSGGLKLRPNKEKFYSGEFPDDYLLRKGDLLIVMTDLVGTAPVLGGAFLIPENNRYLHNQRLGLVTVTDQARLDSGFLYWLFNSHDYRGQIRGSASGATVRHTSPGRVRNVTARVPSDVTTQRQIAETLFAYDDLIANNRRRIQLFEDSVRLLFDEWIVRGASSAAPEGGGKLQRMTLGDLCEDHRQLVLPAELGPSTPYIGLEHMPRRSIALSDWGVASDVSSSKLCYSAGDVVFGKIRPYFHKVGLALTDGVCSSDAIVMRAKAPQWRAFLLALVSSDEFIAATSQAMKEGSKMPRADWKQMKAHQVSFPSQRVLEAFNAVVDPILEQIKILALQARALRAARDLLLPRLMSGELSV